MYRILGNVNHTNLQLDYLNEVDLSELEFLVLASDLVGDVQQALDGDLLASVQLEEQLEHLVLLTGVLLQFQLVQVGVLGGDRAQRLLDGPELVLHLV